MVKNIVLNNEKQRPVIQTRRGKVESRRGLVV